MTWRSGVLAVLWGLWTAAGCASEASDGSPAGDGEGDGDADGDSDSDGDSDGDGQDDADAAVASFIDAAVCTEQRVEAAPAARPADILWVIDNSGSMDEEEDRVQENLNTLSTTIAAGGVDDHVILITDADQVTVPPPLGGSDRFLAIDQEVDSHDALEQLLDTYPEWRDFLRPGAAKHIVVVTDDDSDMSQDEFEEAIAELPEFADGYLFHAIVAEDAPWNFQSPCFMLADSVGSVYIDLQEAHDGVFYSLCLTDWAPVFDALSASVLGHASLPCTFEIPAAPEGEEIDWNAVNFVYAPEDGNEDTIPFVTGVDDCGSEPGWYYDDRDAPTRILACPSTCEVLSDGTGEVDVAFGCATLLE